MNKLEGLQQELSDLKSVESAFLRVSCCGLNLERDADVLLIANFIKDKLDGVKVSITEEEKAHACRNPQRVKIHKKLDQQVYDCPNCKHPVIGALHEQCPMCWSDITWVELAKDMSENE